MKNFAILILSILLIIGCREEDPRNAPGAENQEFASYLPLQTGNYWIYETYEIDNLGNEVLIGETHQISIGRDTTINGETFYLEEDENYIFNTNTKFKRDSSGYIIDQKGDILFSSSNSTDVLLALENGPSRIEYKMDETSQMISVPAGDFDCLNYKGLVTHTDPNEDYPPRILNNYYSEDIGLISSTVFYFGNTSFYYERRLKEYFVQ